MPRSSVSSALKCVRCHETKPRDAFVNDRTRNSGKFPWCKPCVLETRREKKKRDALRPVQPPLEGMSAGRVCPGCEASIDGLHAGRIYCSDPCKEKVRRWAIFGLAPDEYRRLIASNNGLCPICRKKVKRWVLDHNHTTGETMGATCSLCNQSLLAFSYHDAELADRLRDFIANPPVRALLGEPRYVGPDAMEQMERAAGWAHSQGRHAGGLAQAPYVPRGEAA